MADFEAVRRFLPAVQGALPSLTTFELMWADYVDTICRTSAQARNPFAESYPLYVLLEAEGIALEQFEAALMTQIESGRVQDAVIAQSGKDAAALWSIRDGIADLLSVVDSFASFDVGLPVSRMQAFCRKCGSGPADTLPRRAQPGVRAHGRRQPAPDHLDR
ncbi:MAG: FAD-linked oxidase C-terminal domain-containing protein [Thiolinea sp.]